MEILVQQRRSEEFHEFTRLDVEVNEVDRTFVIDLDFSAILERSWKPQIRALDFLVIAAVCYAVDKIVSRKSAPDLWTRTLDVTIPVREPEIWTGAAASLTESLSFLTGDLWSFTFTQAEVDFQKRRQNRRKSPKGFPASPVVSLLSGGLDSFIGALNLLNEHANARLLFVSHYDGHVSGPASDQERLRRFLESKFIGRVSHLQVRSGVVVAAQEENEETDEKYKFETTFRGRSLMFLGLAVYAAAKIGPEVPIIIPENGPISLNMPLNPSRRGACSTRTVHPFFLQSVRNTLQLAEIRNPIENPYELKTKGEMARECAYPELLKEAFPMTNSCGKAGRKTHWANRQARGCGTCVPCLFRRAGLHLNECDTESYGNDALKNDPASYPDFHALLGLIRQKPTKGEIAKTLLANGRLPMAGLDDYVGVVERMISEVSDWVVAKGSAKACSLAGIKSRRS